MTCDEVSARIAVFLQNPDAIAHSPDIEEHFRECDVCRKEYAELINTASAISEVGKISDIIDVSDEFILDTRKKAKRESDRFATGYAQEQQRRKRRILDIALIVFVVITIIAAIFLLYAFFSLT